MSSKISLILCYGVNSMSPLHIDTDVKFSSVTTFNNNKSISVIICLLIFSDMRFSIINAIISVFVAD